MSIFKIHFSIKFTFIIYVIYSIFYKSLNPQFWGKGDTFFFWSIVLCVAVPLWISAYGSIVKSDINEKINKIFNISIYRDRNDKLFDCILNHYTNVATAGLFMALILYVLGPCTRSLPNHLSGFIIALSCILVFFIYSIFLLRLATYINWLCGKWGLIIVMIIFFIDLQAIEIFIKSTPKA